MPQKVASVYSAAGTACIHIIDGAMGKGKEILALGMPDGIREGGVY